MHRVLPAQVPAMFRRRGLRATRRAFGLQLESGHPVCLLVALVADRCGLERAERISELTEGREFLTTIPRFATVLGLQEAYVCGLAVGWDDPSIVVPAPLRFYSETQAQREAYLMGHRDGRTAWQACEADGLTSFTLALPQRLRGVSA